MDVDNEILELVRDIAQQPLLNIKPTLTPRYIQGQINHVPRIVEFYEKQVENILKEGAPSQETLQQILVDIPKYLEDHPYTIEYLMRVLYRLFRVTGDPEILHQVENSLFNIYTQNIVNCGEGARNHPDRRNVLKMAEEIVENLLAMMADSDNPDFGELHYKEAYLLSGQLYGELAKKTLEEFGLPEDQLPEDTEPGQLSFSIGSEHYLLSVEYLVKAAEIIKKLNLQAEIDYLRPILENMVFHLTVMNDFPHDIMQRTKSLSVRGSGVFGDYRARALAVLQYSNYYRGISQPSVAEEALREQLELGGVVQEIKNDLLAELANALSEQGKFAEAEKIQNELLGD